MVKKKRKTEGEESSTKRDRQRPIKAEK